MSEHDVMAISVSETARRLGVSRPTVYQLIRREDFPAFKIGNRTLISVEGLHDWIGRQQRASVIS